MQLYDYQKKDVEKVKHYNYVLNANKMGYGKTIEAIALMQMWKCKRVLIVCPKAVILQWANEIKKWTGLDATIIPKVVHSGDQIVIINYEQLAKGKIDKIGSYRKFTPAPYLEQYFNAAWDLVVCDEVHRIKNRDTMTAKAIMLIPAIRKMGMSGTPILNKPNDLYSILFWLNPRIAGSSYWRFVNKYCEVNDGFFGKQILGLTKNKERQEELVALLEPFTIKNPDLVIGKGKRINEVPLEMGDKQAKLYHNIKNLVLEELPEECTVFNAMASMIRLQQTTTYPEQFEVNDNVKFEWIKTVCEDNPGQKFVVFSKSAKTILGLTKFIKGAIPYVGEMSTKDRATTIERFTNDPSVQVLAGTIGALGQGVDGLQHVCSTSIFLDREWSPALNEQAEDRLNRIGQKDLVDVYVLRCVDTIDEYVGKVNLHKIKDIRRIFK